MWLLAYTGDLGKKLLGRAKLTIKTGAGGRNRRQAAGGVRQKAEGSSVGAHAV